MSKTNDKTTGAPHSLDGLVVARTCEGCKALNYLGNMSCSLGYSNTGRLILNMGIRETKPQEPCPKPKTYAKLIAFRQKRHNAESEVSE